MDSGDSRPKEAPKAGHKWLTASVADDAASVIARVFDEAQRRDPNGRPWEGGPALCSAWLLLQEVYK